MIKKLRNQPYAPKVRASSQMGAKKEKEKEKEIFTHVTTDSLKFHSYSSLMIAFPLIQRCVTFTIEITSLNALRIEPTYEKKALNL
jgi:hypothetical protein